MPEQSPRTVPGGIPLRVILTVPFVIQAVAVAGLIGYLSYRNGQKAVNDVADHLRHEIGARIEEHLHCFLRTPHRINWVNANAIQQGLLDLSDSVALERYLWEQIRIFDTVSSIYFGNAEGGLVDAGREGAGGALYVIATDNGVRGSFSKYATDDQGKRTDLLMTVPDFDARTRPWYTRAVEKDAPVWSDTYVLFTGHEMALASSRPVYDAQKNLVGVASCDIFLSHLSSFLGGVDVGSTGVSFVFERSGLLVATSTGESPVRREDGNEGRRRLHANESATPSIRSTAEFLTHAVGDYHSLSKRQQFEFEAAGQRHFLQVSPVRDEYGIDWLVAVVVPEADFMARISANNRTTASLVAVALIIAVVGGIITKRWVSRPITQLAASVQAFSGGEWKEPAPTGRVREIGNLALSFNTMAKQLAQSVARLTSEVDQRKRVEETLRESEATWRGYLESAPYGVFVTNEKGECRQVNPAACRITGHDRSELLGMSMLDLLPVESRREGRQCLRTAAKDGQAHGEFTFAHKSGEVRWLSLDAVKLSDHRFLGFVRDVTGRKHAGAAREKLQRQLAQAQKMESIGRLAGGVAHDFNNLLMGIINYVELCRSRVEPDHPIRTWLDEITEDAQRSANLTHQLLAFARKQTIAPKALDLSDAVARTLTMLRRLIGEDIDLVWSPCAGLWNVKMDPSQLDQILANLTVNARDAIDGVGRITIETGEVVLDQHDCVGHVGASPGEYVTLTVSDDGGGMDAETREHIFEPFFTTKGVGAGTGLGLATVYGIITQNSGFVDVCSELDRGTTFKAYIPRFVGDVTEVPDVSPAAETFAGEGTILLVEDEKSVRVTMRLFLEDLGYEVLVAEEPEEALRLAARHSGEIRLLITDVIMPGMNGHDLAEILAEGRPQMKRLFMSGYTADIIAHRGVLDDEVNFLAKPFQREELARKVRDVLNCSGGEETEGSGA